MGVLLQTEAGGVGRSPLHRRFAVLLCSTTPTFGVRRGPRRVLGGGVDELTPARREEGRKGLPGEGARGARREGQQRGSGGRLGALSLKGRRKRHALGPHSPRELAGLGGRLLACGRGRGAGRLRAPRPLVLRRSRPSRSLPCAPAWLSLPRSLSGALSRSFSLFSCCRGARTSVGCASGRLPLRSPPGPEPPVGPRFPEPPRPFPPARTPRSAAAGAGLPGAPQLARSLSPEQPLQPGRQLLPASSGTPGGSAPGSVRSVSAARRGPGSGHRDTRPPAAASPRPRARPRPSARCRPRRCAVSCGPRGPGGGDGTRRPLDTGCGGPRAGGGGLGRAPALPAPGGRPAAWSFRGRRVSPRGWPGFPRAPRGGSGSGVSAGRGEVSLCPGLCQVLPGGGRASSPVGAAAFTRPFAGRQGRRGAGH